MLGSEFAHVPCQKGDQWYKQAWASRNYLQDGLDFAGVVFWSSFLGFFCWTLLFIFCFYIILKWKLYATDSVKRSQVMTDHKLKQFPPSFTITGPLKYMALRMKAEDCFVPGRKKRQNNNEGSLSTITQVQLFKKKNSLTALGSYWRVMMVSQNWLLKSQQ